MYDDVSGKERAKNSSSLHAMEKEPSTTRVVNSGFWVNYTILEPTRDSVKILTNTRTT